MLGPKKKGAFKRWVSYIWFFGVGFFGGSKRVSRYFLFFKGGFFRVSKGFYGFSFGICRFFGLVSNVSMVSNGC